jgi:hypothetical protein
MKHELQSVVSRSAEISNDLPPRVGLAEFEILSLSALVSPTGGMLNGVEAVAAEEYAIVAQPRAHRGQQLTLRARFEPIGISQPLI